MRTRQGLLHAAILALSTMLPPDGVAADDPASLDPDLRPGLPGADLDDVDEGDAMAADLFDPVLEACRRQRQNFKLRWRAALDTWAPGRVADLQQRAVHYFCLLMLLDSETNPLTQYARKEVLNRLCREIPGEEIVQAMTRLELEPGDCDVLTAAPELGLDASVPEDEVRRRCSKMVRDFLYSLNPQDAR